MTIPGQPCLASVTFTDASNALFDPAEVVFTVSGPLRSNPRVYRFGVDSEVTHVSLGVFTVQFIPDWGGTWSVDVDAFDSNGRSIEAEEGSIYIDDRAAPIPSP